MTIWDGGNDNISIIRSKVVIDRERIKSKIDLTFSDQVTLLSEFPEGDITEEMIIAYLKKSNGKCDRCGSALLNKSFGRMLDATLYTCLKGHSITRNWR